MASGFARKSLLSLNSWNANGGCEGGGGGVASKRRSNSNTSCKAAAALAATASSMVDFWGRVSQQMAYIDSSTRSSSLVGSLQNDYVPVTSTTPAEMAAAAAMAAKAGAGAGAGGVNYVPTPPPPPPQPLPLPFPAPAVPERLPPPPSTRRACRRPVLASAASCASCTTCSYSSASTASPSPPPSLPPSPPPSLSASPYARPHAGLHRQRSVCEDDSPASRPLPPAAPQGKGSIYENYFHYPDTEDDDAVELQMLQPLAPACPALPPAQGLKLLPTSSTFASGTTADTVSAGGGRRGSGRSRFKKSQKQASLCGRDCRCSGPPDAYGMVARKASSWEESEALQRRRSVMLTTGDAGVVGRGGGGGGALCPVVVPSSSELQLLDKRDVRYYFQHPYPRLFITYFVIFCNFLLFAEDPISHSHTESDIPMLGNVFSFVLTKYPPEWRWSLIKVLMWILAILCGMILGKLLIHGYLCGKLLRLKMFRDDQI